MKKNKKDLPKGFSPKVFNCFGGNGITNIS